MKVLLSFVPPGGGEIDYNREADLPGIPRAGDYVRFRDDPNDPGTSDFIVRRVWWYVPAKPGQGGRKRGR